MRIKNTIIFTALLAMGVSTFAADEVAKPAKEKDHGIRITGGVGPGISEGEIFGFDFPIDDDMGGQVEILYQRRHWQSNNEDFAWIWGAGIMFGSASGRDNEDPTNPIDIEMTIFSVMGQGGVAYKIGDVLVLEAQPYLGLGGANTEIEGFTDGGASYLMYGLKGGAFLLFGDHIELGVELGYQGFTSEVELDFGGPTEDLTLKGDGLHAAGVVNIKF